MTRILLIAAFSIFTFNVFSQSAAELYAKGLQEMEDGLNTEAIASFSAAIKEDKTKAEYYLKRGEAKHSAGKAILAIQDYNKVIQLDPNNSSAYSLRSGIYVELKDYKSAIEDCQKALELNPKDELAYVRMGDAYFSMDPADYVEAMKAYNHAINLNQNNKFALHNRGRAKKELNDYFGAVDDYNKAIILDAEYGSAYMDRGICKSLLGDTPGACIDWYLAGEMGIAEAEDYIATRCNQ